VISKEDWKNIRGSQKKPDHIMLSINGNPETSMTVKWRTDVSVKSGYASYREIGKTEWKKAEAASENFVTDMDDSNYHWADMTGLKPDTKYEYFCGNDEYYSDIHSFKTAVKDTAKFSFIILADTQTGSPMPPPDYSHLGDFLREILKKHPDVSFIMTAGDNTNCGQTDIQWTGLFEGLLGIIESIPYMMAVGNHDDMGFENYFLGTGKYYSEKVEYFSKQFKGSYPDNGPDDWKTANYTFDYGNANFSFIGVSGQEDIDEWLSDNLDKSDKTWKLGVHHFPACYAGCDLACYDTFPVMRNGIEKLDLIFSGHEHCFSRSFPRRNENLYDKPSEGTIHYNCGSGHRNPPGTRSMEKVWNAALYNHEEDLSMYALAEIDGNTLTLTSFIEDGRVADRCVIDKNSDTITPAALAPIYNKTRMKYKGADLGLLAANTFSYNIDGVWYIPAGVLIQYIGGEVIREKGKVTLKVYNRSASFFEGKDTAETDNGEITLIAKVLRKDREQLYVPVDDICKVFNMNWNYYTKNNFISIEKKDESIPVPMQP
jgi:hypothetical protein